VKTGNLWDIFCRVIDNYGDIGVCWRLAVGLAARGARVRLWVDDASALRWMAPEGDPGVDVRSWTQALQTDALPIGDVLVEAFGCAIDPDYLEAYARKETSTGHRGQWINLEYLSAQPYVERCHGLPSPVLAGPGAGLRKHFFYPGFTGATGGLLREDDLGTRQARFDRAAWLQSVSIEFAGERLVSLFCYEPPALGELLEQLAAGQQPTRLLVTAGRATAAVRACIESKKSACCGWNKGQKLQFSFLPTLTQLDFDCLLWACDLNFVRGEDSLVRALWADKPFVWQLYPQCDNAHQDKLEAFLNLLEAPASLRTFHRAWNGFGQPGLPVLALAEWQQSVSRALTLQLQQQDLVTKIMRFALNNH
jgi:uncharacterized repeat protein (TIGR03837 family)